MAVFLVSALPVHPAAAQVLPETCDPDFFDAVEDRAWMETKREIEIAQAFILKPDSTLEYSCFDEWVDELDSYASFEDNIGAALNQVVSTPLNRYLNGPPGTGNFGHSLGGGLGAPGGGGTCETMQAVWDFMRCRNFDKNTFMTLSETIGNDLRTEPDPCDEAGRADKWNVAMLGAYPDPGDPGGVEIVETFLDLVDPASCGGGMPSVPTGLIVYHSGGTHDDAVCTAPACWYDPGTGLCRSTP